MKNKIAISNDSMEDFIWMSYRYCIGRHTIAAAHHADTIRQLIQDNPDCLSEKRKQFMAVDIRKEINSVCQFKKNVHIEGCTDFDAFSTLLYYLSELDIKESHKFKFTVDSYTQTVDAEDIVDELYSWESFENDYIDLIPWVKLANYLDKSCHKIAKVYYEDTFSEYEVYPYPLKIDGKYQKVWTGIGSDLIGNRWLAPEYIVEIKDL